jgi:Tfp pilus assembly protein PilX
VTRSNRGYSLIAALIVLVLVGAAASFVAASLNLRLRVTRQESIRIRLTALNDAVLAETLAFLDQDTNFSGVPEYCFGRGFIASAVTTLESGSEPRVEIIASARIAGRKKQAQVEARLTAAGPVVLSWRRLPGVS